MTQNLPIIPTMKVGFYPISQTIKDFQNVSLYDIIKNNTEVKFLSGGTKYCYRLDYNTLSLVALPARDNYGDNIVKELSEAYIKQQMHSLSGEQKDLCLYTYSPSELVEFIQNNSNLHYSYLPITVHAAESANFIRHDMLLVFDNKNKLFYLFDCKNRNDYLPRSDKLPRDVLDVLFINLASVTNLGYSYEPTESWELQGTLHPYGVGSLDFILSTAWCYNVMLNLPHFESPTAYMSVLDDMPECDRFHLIYNTMLHLIAVNKYHNSIPVNAQADLTQETIKPVTNEVKHEHLATSITIPHIIERDDNTTEVNVNVEENKETKNNDDNLSGIELEEMRDNITVSNNHNEKNKLLGTTFTESFDYDTSRKIGIRRRNNIPYVPSEMTTMPIVSSISSPKKESSNCEVM
jgi:hypothetical protein